MNSMNEPSVTDTSAVTLAFTGASGAPYGLRLLKELAGKGIKVHLLMSSAARVVFATESNIKIPSQKDAANQFWRDYLLAQGVTVHSGQIEAWGKEDWFSPTASGSAAPRNMVVCPCSTGTLSAISTGASDNLIERAADVVIKERGNLIVVVREMPLSSIHLEHMLKLSQLGVTVMPASPGFYHQPTSIDDLVDFVVARILNHLQLSQTLIEPWGYGNDKT